MYAINGNIYHPYTPNVSIYIPYMDPMGYINQYHLLWSGHLGWSLRYHGLCLIWYPQIWWNKTNKPDMNWQTKMDSLHPGQKSNCHVNVNIHLQTICRPQFLYWHCALHLTFVCFCSTAAKLPCNELASSFRADALALADAPLFDGPIGLGPKRARRWLAAAISAARGIRPQNFVWTCCDNGLA